MNSFEAKRPEGEALASDRGALGSLLQIKKNAERERVFL